MQNGQMVSNLRGYEIRYEPRTTNKFQALTYFVANFSPALQFEADEELLQILDKTTSSKWTLCIDGASNTNAAGLSFVLKSPQGDIIAQVMHCEFKATNNEAEYEALIVALNAAAEL